LINGDIPSINIHKLLFILLKVREMFWADYQFYSTEIIAPIISKILPFSISLDAGIDWSKKIGMKIIYGPRGFVRSAGVGLLIEGFDYYPAIGIPYNYPYYKKLIDIQGFRKVTDYYSGYMESTQQLPEKIVLVAEKIKKKGNFWIKTFTNRKELKKYIPLVNKVHHEAFKNNPGYFPSTDEEFELMARMMIQAADPKFPKLLKLIMNGDEVAGFIIAYADISKAIRKNNGQIFPLGWLDMLIEQKKTKIVNFNGLGILPKFQGLGSNALLYSEMEKTIRGFNFEYAEIVQVDEKNYLSKSESDLLGVKWHKIHRTFIMDI